MRRFTRPWFISLSFTALLTMASLTAFAEPPPDDSPYSSDVDSEPPPPPANGQQPPSRPLNPKQPPQTTREKWDRSRQRKYFVPDQDRSDAGIFHVAFAVGGNFYIEPQVNLTTHVATGDYFKDFGFQGGVYFDYDYSALTENVPLGLRGMIGYKYIFSSMHVFAFDGMARYMIRVSDWTTFGVGAGVSAGVWYRSVGEGVREEQTLFVPSFILGAGFEFNPFMTDFKWVITRLGSDVNVMGFELSFGIRL